MCPECARLQASYADASARLQAAQRELAISPAGNHTEFPRLWANCLKELSALSSLREQLAAHRATHGAQAMATHG